MRYINIIISNYPLKYGDFISSYKGHSLLALILSIIFFTNPISIAIALISANLPDFDHAVKRVNVYKMMITGVLIFIVLYVMNLPYFIGIILCIISIIFYLSNHRGFTHSLLCIIFLSILLFIVITMGLAILSPRLASLNLFNLMFSSQLLALVLIIIFFVILIINKKLIAPFLIFFSLGIIFFPNGLEISYFNVGYIEYGWHNMIQMIEYIFFPLVLGFLSHLILDSLTPQGIELFKPFSSKRVRSKFAILSLLLIFILGILKYFCVNLHFLIF